MTRSRIVWAAITVVVVGVLLPFLLNMTRVRNLRFWLSGPEVRTPVTDWTFIDDIQNVEVESRTWYPIPHSVITDICRVGPQVYLFSDYLAPLPGEPDLRHRFPEARFWNRNVVRDPRVRVKIGDKIYRFLAYPVPEPSDEYEVARKECYAKNPDVRATFMVPSSYQPRMHFFRLTQR